MTYLAATDSDLALASLQSAACTYRIALGHRAGQKVQSLKTVPTQALQATAELCAGAHGFSLHAADVRCAANQRNLLERHAATSRVQQLPMNDSNVTTQGELNCEDPVNLRSSANAAPRMAGLGAEITDHVAPRTATAKQDSEYPYQDGTALS